MNSWQIANQTRKLMREHQWADDVAKKFLFGGPLSVVIAADPLEVTGKESTGPVCIITPTDHETDPEAGEDTNLVLWGFQIRIQNFNANDQFGQAGLMGAGKPVGLSSSRGRGLEELLSETRRALASLTKTSGGFTLQVMPFSGAAAAFDQESKRMGAVFRDFTLKVWGTGDPYYAPAENLYFTGATAHTLYWTKPPDRFDLCRLVLCKVAGSTPTTDPTVGVVTSWTLPYSSMPSSLAVVPGSGTWSYSLFAQYDDLHDTIPTSSPVPTSNAAAATVTLTV